MSDELRITFEMELNRAEEYIPTQRLRMMWEYAMDLLAYFQKVAEESNRMDFDRCRICFLYSVFTSLGEDQMVTMGESARYC
ncbi:hypothetical protein ACFL39_00040 [Gemmatimonadota bacterium]